MKEYESEKCLIQIDGGDGLSFIGTYGQRTSDINNAQVFMSEISAYEYVDKLGLNRLAKVRKIVKKTI